MAGVGCAGSVQLADAVEEVVFHPAWDLRERCLAWHLFWKLRFLSRRGVWTNGPNRPPSSTTEERRKRARRSWQQCRKRAVIALDRTLRDGTCDREITTTTDHSVIRASQLLER